MGHGMERNWDGGKIVKISPYLQPQHAFSSKKIRHHIYVHGGCLNHEVTRKKPQVRKIENATSNSTPPSFPIGLRRFGYERDVHCPLGRMRDPKNLTTAHDDD